MDHNADCIIATSSTPPHENHHNLMIRRAFLRFLVLISISSFLVSYYFPGFSFFFIISRNLHDQLLPLFAQALDRKYMFLICNGILAFLAKNLKLSSSGLNGLIMKNVEEGVKEMTSESGLPDILAVQENAAASMDVAVAEEKQVVAVAQQEEDCEGLDEGESEETNADGLILESEEWEEEEEEEEEMEESRGAERSLVSDASVSTEELNRKFEEFIRKMKEEIRIEARQQLIAV